MEPELARLQARADESKNSLVSEEIMSPSFLEKIQFSPQVADEMRLHQVEVESLDCSFLDHIPMAHGVFHMLNKCEKVSGRATVDADESTADMTDDSVSSCESSINSDLISEKMHEKSEECERPGQPEETSRGTNVQNRPSLFRCMSNPMYHSFNKFNVKETEQAKLEINRKALQSRIRQQKIKNELMKRQLAFSHHRERLLEAEVQAAFEIEKRSPSSMIPTRMHSVCDSNSSRGNQSSNECIIHTNSPLIEALRLQIEKNERYLKDLRTKRDEEATFVLKLELAIARLGLVPPEAEKLALTIAHLKSKRKIIMDKLVLAGVYDPHICISKVRQNHEVELESTVKRLSARVQEIQNERNDHADCMQFLQMRLEQLNDSRIKLDEYLESLTSARSLCEHQGRNGVSDARAETETLCKVSQTRGWSMIPQTYVRRYYPKFQKAS